MFYVRVMPNIKRTKRYDSARYHNLLYSLFLPDVSLRVKRVGSFCYFNSPLTRKPMGAFCVRAHREFLSSREGAIKI